MTNSKRLIVLAGSGHKGVVKLSLTAGGAKGNCALDFRPAGATLYLVGDEIAEIALKDINTTFETPFLSNGNVSCLVRSSSLTMFGGDMPHSEMIKRVDAHLKASRSSPKKRDENGASSPSKGENSPSRPDIPKISTPYQASDVSKGDYGQPSPDGSASKTSPATSEPQDISPASEQSEPHPASDSKTSSPQSACASGNALGDASKDPLKDWTRFDGNNFYYAVKPQLDEMFVRYPEDKLLAGTVQNSEWVRVDAVDGAYSVGVLYDGNEPAFICYAVPETRPERRPPAEIEGMCVWLPVSDPALKGYWVIYQSAKTGDIIK